jgi:hypothetical protein
MIENCRNCKDDLDRDAEAKAAADRAEAARSTAVDVERAIEEDKAGRCLDRSLDFSKPEGNKTGPDVDKGDDDE